MLSKITSTEGGTASFSDPELGSITLTFPIGAVEDTIYVEIVPKILKMEHPYIESKFSYQISPHIELNQPVKIDIEFFEGQLKTNNDEYPMYTDRDGVRLVQVEDFLLELPATFTFDITPDLCAGKSMVLTDYSIVLFKNLYLPEQEEFSSHLPTWMKWQNDRESKGHRFFRGIIKENTTISSELERWLDNFFIEGARDDTLPWIFKTGMPSDYDETWVVRGAGTPLQRVDTIKKFVSTIDSFIEDFDDRIIYVKSQYAHDSLDSDITISSE